MELLHHNHGRTAHPSSLSGRNLSKLMKSGIYHVRFSSMIGDHGEGLAVFKDGTVNGGDHGYLYLGTFQRSGGIVSATLRVKRWNHSVASVFGPLSEFTLELAGSVTADDATFRASGPVAENRNLRIEVMGNRIADAV